MRVFWRRPGVGEPGAGHADFACSVAGSGVARTIEGESAPGAAEQFPPIADRPFASETEMPAVCAWARPTGHELFSCDTRAEILALGPAWDRLASSQRQYVPSFSDLTQHLDDPTIKTRMIGWRLGDEVTALAVFLVYDAHRRFWLGEWPILQFPARIAELYGSASLGIADSSQASALLAHIAADRSIDLITFADVPQSDFLYKAASNPSWRTPRNVSQHRSTRRLALLPSSIEDYWSQLRSTTRKACLRDLKMFNKLRPVYTLFSKEDEVADFLSRAANLSAITYLKPLGFAIEDNPQMRKGFARLAAEGRLRGYIASIGGADVAFIWGDVSHGIYYFRMTGFDPTFARYSPGKALLFWAIRELIESGAAHTFDFSGRDMEFKNRFSTSAIPCANLIMTHLSRPRGVALVLLDAIFEIPKTLASRLLEAERLDQLRRALRRGSTRKDIAGPEDARTAAAGADRAARLKRALRR